MGKPRIDSIKLTFGKPRKPRRKAGDTKTLKDGTEMVCKQVTINHFGHHCDLWAHGRPVLEWVKSEET